MIDLGVFAEILLAVDCVRSVISLRLLCWFFLFCF